MPSCRDRTWVWPLAFVATAWPLAVRAEAGPRARALIVDRCPAAFTRALHTLAPLEPVFRDGPGRAEDPVVVRCADHAQIDVLVGDLTLALDGGGPLDEARAREIVTLAAEAAVALARAAPLPAGTPEPPPAGPAFAAAADATTVTAEAFVPPFAFQLREFPQPVSVGAMARVGSFAARDAIAWALGIRVSNSIAPVWWLAFDLAYEQTDAGASPRTSGGVRTRGVSGELALDRRTELLRDWLLAFRSGVRGGYAVASGIDRFDRAVTNDQSLYGGPVAEVRAERWFGRSLRGGFGLGAGWMFDVNAGDGWLQGAWLGSSLAFEWGSRP